MSQDLSTERVNLITNRYLTELKLNPDYDRVLVRVD
jgi:hypothetical protein